MFFKAPSRIANFKETNPDSPLPPKPIITRWGSWQQAIEYYSNYHNHIEKFNKLNLSDAELIELAQQLFKNKSIKNSLPIFFHTFHV
jgi:hypothetical protein